ncbi:MAG: CsgG/HfaB family protein [Spirochaetes bacterium]|nr:CsgG/HfaB family protein [Spirochaetota bacterium]
MIRRKIILLVLLITLFPLLLSAQKKNDTLKPKERIAVMELEAKGVTKDEADAVADFLRTDLAETKKFIVIERARISDVFKEQELSLSGLTDSKNAVKVGEILNCETIIVGTLSKMGNEYFLNIRAVDVETSKTKLGKRESSTNLENLSEVSWFIASKLAGIKYVAKREGAGLFNSPPIGFEFSYGFSAGFFKLNTSLDQTIGTQELETKTKQSGDLKYADLRFGVYLSALYLGYQGRTFTMDTGTEVETDLTIDGTNSTITGETTAKLQIKCKDLMIGFRSWNHGKLNPKLTYFSWRTLELKAGDADAAKYTGPCLGFQSRGVTELQGSPIDFIINFGIHASYLMYDEPAGFNADLLTLYGGGELGLGFQLKNIGLYAIGTYTADILYQTVKSDAPYESTELDFMHGLEVRIGYTFDAQVLFN